MRRYALSVALVIAGAALPAHSAWAGIVNFESIPSTCFFSDVTPGGPRGPLLSFPGVTFGGGVVMDDFANLATTAPNLYGTSDFLQLADASVLPGSIAAVFSAPVSSVSLDVINGFGAATFTLSAYGAGSVFLSSAAIFLADNPNPGAVGSLALSGIGPIHSIRVESGQGTGNVDFAVDSVAFAVEPVPEPGTLLLIGTGLTGLALRRRRRS